jgi:thiamine-monophosphate kinase
LFSKVPTPASVALGIGDDAALIRPGSGQLVWTIDAAVQGVHFDWRWLSANDLGWRSFQAAASDIAAMGARPIAALSSLALPKALDRQVFRNIARGQASAARSLGCAIAGGNLTRSQQLAIHTTLIGSTNHALRRDGARRNDELWLIGQLGAAAAGLLVLKTVPKERQSTAERWCVHQWRRPTALVEAGISLRQRAHAAIDVSDGLAADLGHLAKASNVRAVLDAAALEQALDQRLHQAARTLKKDPLQLALFGGEDYALLAAGPAHKRPTGAFTVGRFEKGRGVWLCSARGTRPLARAGFDHFR